MDVGIAAPRWDAMLLVSNDTGVVLHSTVPPPPWEQLETPTRALDVGSLTYLTRWRAGGDPEEAAATAGISADERSDLDNTLAAFGLLGDATAGADPADAPAPPAAQDAAPSAVDPDHDYVLATPQVWRVGPDRLERYDHDGALDSVFSPAEVMAAQRFDEPTTPAAARPEEPDGAAEFDAALPRLLAHGVVVDATADPHITERAAGPKAEIKDLVASFIRLKNQMMKRIEARETELAEAGAPQRIAVYPVLATGGDPPLALGVILSRATNWDDGRLAEHYDLFPRWVDQSTDPSELPDGPAIFLFSDYIWSHQVNLDFNAKVKAANPQAICIHGGPDCPSYELDTLAYHRHHPYVDIAVRGEGEETACAALAAIGPSLLAGEVDMSALADVAGLSYRHGDDITRTGDRDRMTELDIVPSPYTNGVLDAFGELPSIDMAILETNRGCPYGCTFCDWGSATNSRIRKFSMDRIFEELDWIATHQVKRLFIADANFGIFARDVEVAEHIAKIKAEHGYPQRVLTNYAKNTVKHLQHIVEILTDAGIVTEGLLSLQSMDDDTLNAIRRSNIKLEKYEDLAAEFRGSDLPLFVDLMMGLPGQTIDSLRRDLQECVNREVLAKCHGTELLVNSPMNDPDYRDEFQIETSRPPGPLSGQTATSNAALVVSSTTFTRDDYNEMHRMRRTYLLSENLGVLRYISRFVRHRAGIHEVDFVERVRVAAGADPDRWPTLRLVTHTLPDAMVQPVSWRFMIDELHEFLTAELGIADDAALRSALAAQHAVLPAPGRTFPYTVELDHDFGAWHHEVLELKLHGHRDDWETVTPDLADFGPARLTVTDPRRVCARNLGRGSAILAYNDWELDSTVARPVPAHHQV